ncbi:major capsid protein [Enterococcus dispar]|uniref:major capsid protein n=1 Tax=Enterococcus dispar TaxID=44009 RepID=UPI00189E8B07|nr:phage capsid protein [Enterococcus dispar]WCG33981.1 hypothetical protein PML78_04620 [Enterococcus dispar]
MPVTLEQAKVTMQDKIIQAAIDEFRRSSFLLDQMIFDDAVSPGTGGSTLVYGYSQLKTPSTAAFRKINQEYTANEADRQDKSVKLKIFGGSYEVDRVIQNTSGQLNESAFQMEQKIKGAANLFHYTAINGDSAVDADSFDGLDKMLTGSSTELGTDKVTDLTDVTNTKFKILESIDDFLSELDGKPTMLMGNGKLINMLQSLARQAGFYSRVEDAFGRKVGAYDGIPMVDLGYFYNGTTHKTDPVVANATRTIGEAEVTGLTDLYAVSLGLDGFHGVTPLGSAGITAYMPNFTTPGAVKKGEVEMVAGVALKATRKAGVLRNLKVM